MSSSAGDIHHGSAKVVKVTQEELRVVLSDGRTIAVPLAWDPRVFHGTSEARADWRLIGKGSGIHGEALGEDIRRESGIPEKVAKCTREAHTKTIEATGLTAGVVPPRFIGTVSSRPRKAVARGSAERGPEARRGQGHSGDQPAPP